MKELQKNLRSSVFQSYSTETTGGKDREAD